MSKHEIVFPCGCIITIFQFENEQPRIEKEPCKEHKGGDKK
uniref:Uncharacterized protein n=1 Tax=viral metagenome TaxID=1070528 RepID=A0A6M3LNZ3_9ZZZZ